jgi:hypothetical protein
MENLPAESTGVFNRVFHLAQQALTTVPIRHRATSPGSFFGRGPGRRGRDRLATEQGGSHVRRPLYQRSEGADEDRWRLALDTETSRLFVEHEKRRGDFRGAGYAIETDEIELAEFLKQPGQGREQLVKLLETLFADDRDVSRPVAA